MRDVLVFIGFGIGLWIFYRIAMKEPIIPWGEKKTRENNRFKKKKNPNNKSNIDLDEEPQPFKDLFKDLEGIQGHMLRYKDDTFVMLAEVEPVNYFLLSQAEQEAIDVVFERWLAQTNYRFQIYLQNRYVDLSDQIESMRKSMEDAEDLSENAREYAKTMVEDLTEWQRIAPRFETKRYLLNIYQVKSNDISADNKDELEQKIVDKAFSELSRRYFAARNQLRKARIDVQLLTSEGITEVLYHAFNRKRAVKSRFKDFGPNEMLSLFVTSDQDDIRVNLVKEGLEDEAVSEKEREEEDKAS
ncbi:hypothetical protein [Terribacillus saccharophilus]|uniref:hypothetical protein n=1 Tax=Terribacillus saccharophilus TaxID=361277 RepID=UPI003D2D7B86